MENNTKALLKSRCFYYFDLYKSGIYISILCIVSILLGTKGITKEEFVSLQGDMPRYLMNGVYFYDLIKELPFPNIIGYTYKYYAKYPALSLGHHPPFLGISEVPFYSIFGISIFSARLTILFFAIIAVVFWFLFIKSVYSDNVAFFSSLLFITTPSIAQFSRVVMAEIPALALIILAIYFFNKYCETGKHKHAVAFFMFIVLSVYTRYISVFFITIFLIYLILSGQINKLIRKEIITLCIISTLLIISLFAINFKFTPHHISSLINQPESERINFDYTFHYINVIWKHNITIPVILISIFSVCNSLFNKDARILFFVVWIVGFYLQLNLLGFHNSRFSIYWIPAFCLFAALSFDLIADQRWKITLSALLLLIIGYQFMISFQNEVEYAGGYEQAAQYVVENRKGVSVLFSGKVDTGYFIFFVRKHNSSKELVVLRADKLLATSAMDRIVEERINNRKQIYTILKNYGIGYVVIEDKEFESRSLEWLRKEVKSKKFILRKRIPIRSKNHRLQNVTLAIYEYKEYTPFKRGQVMTMNIPLMGDSITIQFDELVGEKSADLKH